MDKNQRWLYSAVHTEWHPEPGVFNQEREFLRYYTEKELPSDVRKQIKWTYEDFNITSVKEVRRNNEPVAYLATIKNANTWKDIRVVDSDIEVLDEYVSN